MSGKLQDEKGHSDKSASVITVTLTSDFKLVFLSVLAITVLSMIISCSMVLSGFDLEGKSLVVQALITTWKLGFGAIVGLFGGKAM